MKREEMVEIMAMNIGLQAIEKGFHHIDLSWLDVKDLLQVMEDNNMFYCPVEDLGDFGKLRTPKGWE